MLLDVGPRRGAYAGTLITITRPPHQRRGSGDTMARVHRDEVELSALAGRAVAVIGYGAEAEAHALCLRDSGVDVRVGLLGDARRGAVEDEGFHHASADVAA